MTTVLGSAAFAALIFWVEYAPSPFSVFNPVNSRKKVTRTPSRFGARFFWYCFIAVCVVGIMLAMAQQAEAQEAPTPALGCHIFDGQGRVITPSEMTDKQLMQAMGCEKVAQDQNAFAHRMADSNGQMDATSAKMQAAADAITKASVTGYASPIPTPLPGNTPTVVILSQ